ncbi:hypothetical protein WA158_000014 [Blastocystis sp. Blastoise]
MISLAVPRNNISDQQHIFSQITKIKHVLTEQTNEFYHNMVTISTAIDKVYDFLSQTMHYLEQKTESPSSFPDLPEVLIHEKDDVQYDVNPGFVTFVCKEGNMHYPLPTSILRSYPESNLYEMYQNPETRRVGGYLYVDQSEVLFPYILDYIQGHPMNIDQFNDDLFEDILDSLSQLGIPCNVEMKERHSEIVTKKMMYDWTQNDIRFNINNELYVIRRSDLRSLNIYNSMFNCKLDNRVTYDSVNHAFQFVDNIKYFHYVEQYIQTGELIIPVEDIDALENIEKEFIYFNINKTDIWRHYKLLNYIFPDSKLMNTKLTYEFSNWIGNNKMFKLLYRGSRDGYTAHAFHECCDNHGETVLFIKAKNDKHTCLFGGYSSIPWNKDAYDSQAFLFTLQNPYEIPPTRFVSKPKQHNIIYKQLTGPIYGNTSHNDLLLGIDMTKPNNNYIGFNGEGSFAFNDLCLNGNQTELIKIPDDEVPLKIFTGGEVLLDENNQKYVDFIVDEIEVYGL